MQRVMDKNKVLLYMVHRIIMDSFLFIQMFMVISHDMDSLLKLIFSNPNKLCTFYSMYPKRQSIKVMNDNLHS